MFFIGQNLNHVHMTYSFLELLIFFWFTQVDIYCLEFISHHIKGILYLNINSKGNQPWNKHKHFHLFLSINKKTNIFTYFFYINIKIPYEQSFFSVSWIHFQKQPLAHVRSNDLAVRALNSHSRDPVFNTIGWLQDRLSLSFFQSW